jgi:hypothetical protein
MRLQFLPKEEAMKDMKTVAVDLDGVLATYDGWSETIGEPIEGAQEFVRNLQEFATVVIWTTRANSDAGRKSVVRWLDEHGFNENGACVVADGAGGKFLSSAWIDDRAVSCRPQKDAIAYEHAVSSAKQLVDGTPVGATGEFPDGSMDNGDEGELRMAVFAKDGCVVIDFGKPTSWIGLAPDQAQEFAHTLLKWAEKCQS